MADKWGMAAARPTIPQRLIKSLHDQKKEKRMDKRTTAILAIILTTIFCGIPGLCILAFGLFLPFSVQTDLGISQGSNVTLGIALICLGVTAVIIPIVVAFVTLRRKPESGAPPRDQETSTDDEPLPPPS
jgi:hypothetical protein